MLLKKLVFAGRGLFVVTVLGVDAIARSWQAPAERQEKTLQEGVSVPAKEPKLQKMLRLEGKTSYPVLGVQTVEAPYHCRVEKVLVELGSRVKKGDPLV